MKRVIISVGLLALLLAVFGCEKTASTTDRTVFNGNPSKLASIPTGYEMRDALFSADGQHVMIATTKDSKTHLFSDSMMSVPYDGVRTPVFRAGYSDRAFVAQKDGKEFAVVNGNAGDRYDGIGRLFITQEGQVVYEAKRDDAWFIIAGKRKSRPFASSQPSLLVVSSEKRVAYKETTAATNKSSISVCSLDLKDCAKGKEYDEISDMVSALSGSRLAYVARNAGKMCVVSVDIAQKEIVETEERWYDNILSVRLSENGAHLAYLASAGGTSVLVNDGAETPADSFDLVFDMAVAGTGRTIFSAMVKGKVAAFVDGKKAGKEYSGINALRFCPDGSSYVFTAEKGGKSVVVINGRETPALDMMVTPKFSPDCQKIVYRARNKGERFVVVADLHGRTIREHAHHEAVWDVTFSPDGTLVGYGIKTGQEFWWKVEQLDTE